MPNKKYLSPKEIGEILEVSRQAVQQWVVTGQLKSLIAGRSYRIKPDDLLQYLKDKGNSDYAMKEFEYDINFFLMERALKEAKNPEDVKALAEKDPKMFKDVLMNSKTHFPGKIVGYEKGKNDDPFKSDPFKGFEEYEEAKKYINEAKTPEEEAKRFAEVKNYIKGTGDNKKPWDKQ